MITFLGSFNENRVVFADVTPAGSPDRAERAIVGMMLAERFLVNPGHICGRGATLLCRKSPLEP